MIVITISSRYGHIKFMAIVMGNGRGVHNAMTIIVIVKNSGRQSYFY